MSLLWAVRALVRAPIWARRLGLFRAICPKEVAGESFRGCRLTFTVTPVPTAPGGTVTLRPERGLSVCWMAIVPPESLSTSVETEVMGVTVGVGVGVGVGGTGVAVG